MSKWIEKLESLLGGGPGGEKRIQTFRWIAILGAVGFALMLLNSFFTLEEKTAPIQPNIPNDETQHVQSFAEETSTVPSSQSSFRDIEQRYETALKEVLENIVGVGEVDVLVTIESTEEIVVERNTNDSQRITNEEETGSGLKRHITDVTRNGEVILYEHKGGQTPIVVKTIKPKIRGVLIVARGAEEAVVKKMLVEAVERGVDVAAHRISVVPRKQ